MTGPTSQGAPRIRHRMLAREDDLPGSSQPILLMKGLRLRDLPRVALDSQSAGSLPLTMAREVNLPSHTHVPHSFSTHGLKCVA